MDDTVNNSNNNSQSSSEEGPEQALSAMSRRIAVLLEEHQALDIVVLDVRECCSWTDFFVIATVSSYGHLRGLLRHLQGFTSQHRLRIRHNHKRLDEDGWVLLDCGNIVIHLMDEKTRNFYELERLWFNAEEIYQSSKSS